MQKVSITHSDNEGSFLNLPSISDELLFDVTIVTPTYNRHDVIDIAIRNFKHFNYPKKKLNWIILDDSPIESSNITKKLLEKELKDELENGKVKYIYSHVKMPIGKKRNMLAEESKTTIICHMDDDDYYYPDSIKVRVVSLIAYKKAVSGTLEYNCYNLVDDSQFIARGSEKEMNVGEASLCYLKDFWLTHKYNDDDTHEESIHFLKNSINDYIDIPCLWILLSITHGKNVSGRRAISPVLAFSFLDTLPVNDFEYIRNMKLKLMLKDPENSKCMQLINDIQKSNNPERIIDKLTIKQRKNVLIREFLNTKPTKNICSDKDFLIICFPGQYIRDLDFEKETKLINFIKENKDDYRFTIYTNCDKGYQFDKITLSPSWKWRTSNKFHNVLIWNEPSHLKLNVNANKILFYNEYNFELPEMKNANYIFTDFNDLMNYFL